MRNFTSQILPCQNFTSYITFYFSDCVFEKKVFLTFQKLNSQEIVVCLVSSTSKLLDCLLLRNLFLRKLFFLHKLFFDFYKYQEY